MMKKKKTMNNIFSYIVFVVIILSTILSFTANTSTEATSETTSKGLTTHEPIYINGNSQFTFANGVTDGSGTESDPYIIENWDINASTAHGIEIKNTDVYFVIRNCVIHDGWNTDLYDSYHGIYFYDITNGKIDNITSYDNWFGILLDSSSSSIITNCSVYNNINGIDLSSASNNNQIINCTIYNNSGHGFFLSSSSNNTVIGNTFTNDGIYIWSSSLEYFTHSIGTTNLVNGKPLYYFLNQNNLNIDDWDIGQLILVNCTNSIIKNVNISHTETGIELAFSINISITNCTFYNNDYGVSLWYSPNNQITNCTIYNNTDRSIWLVGFSNNNQITNCAIYNSYRGICLDSSSNNQITNCEIYNNYGDGIVLAYSSNNEIHYCNIYNNTDYGVHNRHSGTQYTLSATYNCWGSADGPSGVGPGSGDAITSNVIFYPWLDESGEPVIDNTLPTSSVNLISPYWQTSTPFTITATASDTGGSGVANVSLYYRYSNDNASWGSWTLFGINYNESCQWSFTVPSGNGYYKFYSIAKDNAGNVESAPATYDAECKYAPTGLTPHAPIYINGNSDFTEANGVTGGNGTQADPYIIENWEINASSANGIEIKNTDAYLIIRNCIIHDGKSSYDGVYLYTFRSTLRNIEIVDCVLENNKHSIHLYAYSHTQSSSDSAYSYIYNINIIDNVVTSNNGNGLYLHSFSDSYSYPGTYASSCIYDVNVADNVITTNTENGICFQSSSDSAYSYIYDVNITGNTITSNTNNGVYLCSSPCSAHSYIHDVNIATNTITSNTNNGIYLHSSSSAPHSYGSSYSYIYNINITDNTITSNTNNGIYLYTFPSDTFFSSSSSYIHDVNIVNNTITSNTDNGISLHSSNGLPSSDYYSYLYNVNIIGNIVCSNMNNGIHLLSSPYTSYYAPSSYLYNVNIIGNIITSNTNNGIYLLSTPSPTYCSSSYAFIHDINITDNMICFNADTGVHLNYSDSRLDNLNIFVNNISSNGYGLYFIGYCANYAQIYKNNIMNNTCPAYDDHMNGWDDGNKVGNYWDDYNGADTNGDRIGDTSYYNISGVNNKDNYPLISPYGTIPPIANFTFFPLAPTDLETTEFTDSSEDIDGTIVDWLWELGDGNNSTLQHPTHHYIDNGNYTIRLTIWDDSGKNATVEKPILILNVLPTANFTFLPLFPVAVDTVELNSTLSKDLDGYIVSWYWDFDDGNTSTLQNPIHRYARRGSYLVNLTVTDDDNASTTFQTTVDVLNSQPTLSGVIVTPETGTEDTEFIFRVVYADPDGDIPLYVNVIIDGTAHNMTYISGDYVSGALYEYRTKLSRGEHKYRFECDDNSGALSSNATTQIGLLTVGLSRFWLYTAGAVGIILLWLIFLPFYSKWNRKYKAEIQKRLDEREKALRKISTLRAVVIEAKKRGIDVVSAEKELVAAEKELRSKGKGG